MTRAYPLYWSFPKTRDTHAFAKRFAVDLSLPVFKTQVCRDWGSNPDLPHERQPLHHRGGRSSCSTLDSSVLHLLTAFDTQWLDVKHMYMIFVTFSFNNIDSK